MNSSRGFSLVELMISLVLGSIVSAGVIQLFVANSETANLLQGQSRMQESARFALEFMSRSIRDAGYRGCFSSPDDLDTTLLPVTALPYEFDLRFGVEGYEATGASTWTPGIMNELPYTDAGGSDTNVFSTPAGEGAGNGIDLDAIVSGTDIITTRNASQVEARLKKQLQSVVEDPIVAVRVGWNEFDIDHLVLIHDCEKASIFRVTDMVPDLGGAPSASNQDIVIGHDQNDTDATRNSKPDLAPVNTFDSDAAISAIETHTFFIAPGAGVNNDGNTPLSLWRKTGIDPPMELVEGVEDLQILYGVDTDGDNAPNQYVRANFVGNWNQVVTIRVTVVVNSVDNVGATTTPTQGCTIQDCISGETIDGLLRRSFTQTIQLRNDG